MSNENDFLIITDRSRLDEAITEIVLQIGPSLIDIKADELENKPNENFVMIANTVLKMMPEVELVHVGRVTQILCTTLVQAVPLLQREYLESVIADGNA